MHWDVMEVLEQLQSPHSKRADQSVKFLHLKGSVVY